MKSLTIFLSLFSLLVSSSLLADVSVKLENVHLCCKACERGVVSALDKVDGATAVADRESGTVVISATDKKILRKGVNAMVQGGFHGTSTDSSVKVRDLSKSSDKMVKSVTVTGVHLCCNGCVDAVEDALDTVDGVAGNTLEKKVDSFQVQGNFNQKDLFAALNKAGFAGKVSE